MLSLLLLYALMAIAGASWASLLQLPTRHLRWTMGMAAGCGQLILAVQILSLFHALRGPELLIANGILSTLVGCVALYQRRNRTGAEGLERASRNWKEILAEAGTANVLLAIGVLLAFGCGILVAPFAFPATDTYHFNMCLFWRQNQSIAAFLTPDPRAVSVVFASEVLALPGILYANSAHGFVLFTGIATVLSCWLIYTLAGAVGASVRVAISVSLVFAGTTSCAGSIWAAKSDFLLSTVWLLGSLCFLLETRSYPERSRLLVSCSVFLLAMACGAKNTIVLHAVAFALVWLLILGRNVWNPRFLARMALFGIMGALVSGVLWSYVQNKIWFGDWRGHPFLKQTLAEDYEPLAIWTRLCRGFVTVLYDCGWVPNSIRPEFAQLHLESVRLLGGKSALTEDNTFYSFTEDNIRPGSGMGIVGPLVLLPSFLMAFWVCFRRRRDPVCIDAVPFRALVAFGFISFLTSYVVLRAQRIGVTRLMVPCVAAAMPITWLILRGRIGHWVGISAAAFSLLVNTMQGVRFAANRADIAAPAWLRSPQGPSAAIFKIQWGDRPAELVPIRDSNTTRELYALISDQIRSAGKVGLVGGFNTEGFFCFGPELSNQVIVLKDCRSESVSPPPIDLHCVIVEGFDPRKIDPAVMPNFEQVFQASREGAPVLTLLRRKNP